MIKKSKIRGRWILGATLSGFFLFSTIVSSEARVFTSTDGRTLNATVTKVAGQSAVLKLGNGRSVTVPFDRLAEADREFLKEWAKEDAKNRVPRVKVEIDSNKRDSNVDSSYFEDRKGSIKFEIDVTNQERGFRIEKATATLVVLGDYLYEKDTQVVMQRVEFKDIAFDFDKTYRMTAKEVRYEYDKSGYKHGVKYDGYLFIMKTAAGKIMDVSGSSTRVENLAEIIMKLKQGEYCNDRYEKITPANGSSSTIIR